MTDHNAENAVTIPRPQILTGPQHQTVDEATIAYLREAANRVRSNRYWGSGVSRLVATVLDDAATAMTGSAKPARLEWQAAEGSATLHVIDTLAYAKPPKSGPRALCGKYPQRNAESPWWSLPVNEMPDRPGFNLTRCTACDERLPPEALTPTERPGSQS